MIGLCSVTFRDKEVEEVIQIAKDARLEAIEWAGDKHVPVNKLDHAKQVRKWTREAGLVTSSYGSYYKVGSHGDFEAIIKTAEALDTKMIRVWAGSRGSEKGDNTWFETVVGDTERIAKLAHEKRMSISFEYHSKTLTDTPKSANELMEAIHAKNVFLYWQPAERMTQEERKNSLAVIGKWITNVHVFQWKNFENRFTLKEGAEEWEQYICSILQYSPYTNDFLLEFVKNDNPEQLKQDAQMLKELLGRVT